MPVTLIAQPPQVIVVNPAKVRAGTLAELVDFARKNPGKLNYGSAGNGSAHHGGRAVQTADQDRHRARALQGSRPRAVRPDGGPVDMMFDGLGSSAQHIRSGRIKALAVAASKRSAAFPNVPTAAEAGVANYDVSTRYALWAPKGTPREVVERLHAEVEKALNTPELKQIWLNNGSETPAYTPEQFGKFLHAEVRRWAQVVQQSGATID